MNAAGNCLGQGNRANLTIGRALQLVVRNVGGGRPRRARIAPRTASPASSRPASPSASTGPAVAGLAQAARRARRARPA